MDRRVVCVVALLIAAGTTCKKKSEPTPDPEPSSTSRPERIITLTPSATELVVAVGAVHRLVATDKYSDEPPSVAALPKVGDFLAPNVEAIAKLEPELVVCDKVQSKAAESLAALDIPVLSIKMHSIADIRRELAAVADAVGEVERGQAVLAEMERALDRTRSRAASRARAKKSRPRVLWVMDRQPGGLAEIVAAGPGSFASELLELVGAANAVTGSIRYPKLSRESLLKIDADVVVDASAASNNLAPWASSGGSWRVVGASTDLATPGPGIGSSVTRVEALVFDETPPNDRR